MKTNQFSLLLALCAFAIAGVSARAAVVTWDNGGGDLLWSNTNNWSPDSAFTGNDVVFVNTGGAAGSTVTSTFSTSGTIASLNFRHDNSVNHTLSISDGQTLSVTGSFTPVSGEATAVLFGIPTTSSTVSTTNITGTGGTLTVNSPANHFLVGFVTVPSSGHTVTVNMLGLGIFNATVDIFGVGRKGTVNAEGSRQQAGVLTLSKNSTITANEISVGSTKSIEGTAGTQNNGSASTLFLGSGGGAVNNLYADSIEFGVGKAVGNMEFSGTPQSTDLVKIRAKNGSSPVGNWNIGYRNMSSSSGTPGGTINFEGGIVDALVTNLFIARWGATGTGNNVSPSATFTTGTNAASNITTGTLEIARNSTTQAPSSGQTMNGTLNVTGGTFSATTVNLALGTNTTNLTRTATLNVEGGIFRFGSFGTPVGGYSINFKSGTVSSIDGTGRTLALAYNLGQAGGSTVTFGQLTGGTGTLTLNGSGTLQGNTTLETVVKTTLGGAVSGTFGITKTGNGILEINQNQSYSGGTTINEGTLKMSGNRTLAASSDMEIGPNGTWTLDGSSQVLDQLLGSGTITSAYFVSGTDALTVASGSFAGPIAGGNGASLRAISLTKTGDGTLILAGTANTYSSLTTLSGGILNVASVSDYGAAGSLGNRASDAAGNVGILFRGGTMQYTGSTAQSTNRAIRVSTTGGGATIDASGSDPSATLSFTGTSSPDFFENNGNRSVTLTGGNTGANTFALPIGEAGGVTTLIKSGTGKWVLSGSSTYSGTTSITGGVLALASSGKIDASTAIHVQNGATFDVTAVSGGYTVPAGQTLRGNGSILGGLTIGSGTLAPGASVGTLSQTGTLSLGSASTFALEIDTTAATADRINVSGDLSITAGAALSITDLGGDAPLGFNTVLTIIDYAGTWNGTAFSGYADGSSFVFGANEFEIYYGYDLGGGDLGVALLVVPEPSAALSLLCGAGVLALFRRRR